MVLIILIIIVIKAARKTFFLFYLFIYFVVLLCFCFRIGAPPNLLLIVIVLFDRVSEKVFFFTTLSWKSSGYLPFYIVEKGETPSINKLISLSVYLPIWINRRI